MRIVGLDVRSPGFSRNGFITLGSIEPRALAA